MEKNFRFNKSLFSVDVVAIIALVASAIYPITWPFSLPSEYWIKQGFEHVLFAGLYFFNLIVLVPRFLNTKQNIKYSLLVILSIVTVVAVILLLSSYLNLDIIMTNVFKSVGHPGRPNLSFDIRWLTFLCVIVWGVSYMSAVVRKLQVSQLAFQVSEKDRVSAELSFLKAQINPHFFFNTLHTIYSLMDTDQPSAKGALYNLSHMMRYVLYETKNDETSLFKELSFIEDYIALMKVRISGEVQIIFDKQPGLSNMNIAPMLFLPFVENAFKHGISGVHPSYILIDVAETSDQLNFEVRNTLFEDMGKQLEGDEGIGIINTRRRLDLIYPDRYSLVVDKDKSSKEFSIALSIKK